MTILRFPARRRVPVRVANGAALAQAVISECRGRRAVQRREGVRLRAALLRLRVLRRAMARDRRDLRRSIARLHACRTALGAARLEV